LHCKIPGCRRRAKNPYKEARDLRDHYFKLKRHKLEQLLEAGLNVWNHFERYGYDKRTKQFVNNWLIEKGFIVKVDSKRQKKQESEEEKFSASEESEEVMPVKKSRV
jgi:hypothetical protein